MALKRINLNLDENLLAEIDVYAEKWGTNRTSAISVMCSQYIEQSKALQSFPSFLALMSAHSQQANQQANQDTDDKE